jgi:hypothetical protein
VPPPRDAKAVKYCIAKVENIKDKTSISLFFSPYSHSPMGNSDKITSILNGTGPGCSPQEPLALVAKMSVSERSALESDGRGGPASTATEPDITTPPGIRYGTSIQHSPLLFVTLGEVHYLLYDGNEILSKVAFDPEEPFLGRIRADSVAPPHDPTSIKRCILRVEENPALAWHANLFANTSSDIPLKEGHISFLRADAPGLSPKMPMAIVVPVEIWRAKALYDCEFFYSLMIFLCLQVCSVVLN